MCKYQKSIKRRAYGKRQKWHCNFPAFAVCVKLRSFVLATNVRIIWTIPVNSLDLTLPYTWSQISPSTWNVACEQALCWGIRAPIFFFALLSPPRILFIGYMKYVFWILQKKAWKWREMSSKLEINIFLRKRNKITYCMFRSVLQKINLANHWKNLQGIRYLQQSFSVPLSKLSCQFQQQQCEPFFSNEKLV